MRGYKKDKIPTCRQIPPENSMIFRRSLDFLFVASVVLLVVLRWISWFIDLFEALIVFVGAVLFLTILSLLYQWQYYKSYYYDLGENAMLVNTWGFHGRKREIPYEKIEKVSICSNSLDLLFDLYNLRIERSCIGSGSDYEACFDVYISGLNEKNAEKLREMILEKVEKARKHENQ